MAIRTSSIRGSDDILEVRIYDSKYNIFFKQKADIKNIRQIAEILDNIKKMYGLDLRKLDISGDEIDWFG
jgi:hypothetical protein